MTVFEALALIICICLVIGSIVGTVFFVLMMVERKRSIHEFEKRTGRKF